jgi:Tfp pilus assembly protein PilO
MKTFTHVAHWPLPARAALLLAAALACAGSGLWLHVGERDAARRTAQEQRRALQARLSAALARSAGLPVLRRHEGELAMRLLGAEEQLWPDQDAALLQAKLARRAEECGLALEWFKPAAAAPGRPATGAEIGVAGGYAELLRFVELVTRPPRPVLFEAMELAPRAPRDGHAGPGLLMNATVSIVPRRSDQEEKT